MAKGPRLNLLHLLAGVFAFFFFLLPIVIVLLCPNYDQLIKELYGSNIPIHYGLLVTYLDIVKDFFYLLVFIPFTIWGVWYLRKKAKERGGNPHE